MELGPNPVLTGMGRRGLSDAGIAWATSLKAGEDEWRTLLAGVATAYAAGRDIDWAAFDADYRRQRVALPTYPFDRSRHWIDLEGSGNGPGMATVDRGHPLTRVVAGSPHPTVQVKLAAHSPPFLADHQVQGQVVVPGTMFVELMLDAAADSAGGPGVPVPGLDDVEFARALFVPPGSAQTLQAIVTPDGGGRRVHVYSRDAEADAEWVLRASGSVTPAIETGDVAPDPAEIPDALARCTTEIDPALFYEGVAALGLAFGDSFQGIRKLYRRPGEAVALIEAPASLATRRVITSTRRCSTRSPSPSAWSARGSRPRTRAGCTCRSASGACARGHRSRTGSGRTSACTAMRWPGPRRWSARCGPSTRTATCFSRWTSGGSQVVDADGARLVAEDAVTDWLYKPTWQPLEARDPAPAAIWSRRVRGCCSPVPANAGAEAERLRAWHTAFA